MLLTKVEQDSFFVWDAPGHEIEDYLTAGVCKAQNAKTFWAVLDWLEDALDESWWLWGLFDDKAEELGIERPS